jgi:hypothetical protein
LVLLFSLEKDEFDRVNGLEKAKAWHHGPRQPGGEVQSHRTHGSIRAHFGREVRSRDLGHVTASKPIPAGGRVRSYRARGSTWVHALLLVLS